MTDNTHETAEIGRTVGARPAMSALELEFVAKKRAWHRLNKTRVMAPEIQYSNAESSSCRNGRTG